MADTLERNVGRAVVALAWVIPAGVLVQAALAGQAWFVTPALFGMHGGIGHGVLLIAALVMTFTLLLRLVGPAVLATGLVLGLIAQTGLGYVGHRTEAPLASSLHIPLGVAIFGAAIVLALAVTRRQPTTGEVDSDGGVEPAEREPAEREPTEREPTDGDDLTPR